jgi:hypothetical protein
VPQRASRRRALTLPSQGQWHLDASISVRTTTSLRAHPANTFPPTSQLSKPSSPPPPRPRLTPFSPAVSPDPPRAHRRRPAHKPVPPPPCRGSASLACSAPTLHSAVTHRHCHGTTPPRRLFVSPSLLPLIPRPEGTRLLPADSPAGGGHSESAPLRRGGRAERRTRFLSRSVHAKGSGRLVLPCATFAELPGPLQARIAPPRSQSVHNRVAPCSQGDHPRRPIRASAARESCVKARTRRALT